MRRISALVCDLDVWNSVNNQICAPPVRDPLGFSHKILLCVEDDVVSAAVALVAHTLIPTMPWAEVIALGAVVAPPDAVAATAVLRPLRPPHRVLTILEGESLLNDASALLIFRLAVGAVVAKGFSIAAVAPTFLLAVVGIW
jgi:monovalent cation/hydrogen antiporter